MTEVKTAERKADKPAPKPWLVPVLATALIAVVAGALLVNVDSGVASPESVATAYIDALVQHDAQAIGELLAPSGHNDLDIAWERAVGRVRTDPVCEERSTGPDGILVKCTFGIETDLTRALDLEPASGTSMILVSQEHVRTVSEGMNNADGVHGGLAAFRTWLDENHPTDVATMYDLPSGDYRSTPASIALWEQYVDEFVASHGG